MSVKDEGFEAGGVVLMGATNAGKTSLMNALAGEKAGIVTRKVHTTREASAVRLSGGGGWLRVVDTPGTWGFGDRGERRETTRRAWREVEGRDVAWVEDAARKETSGAWGWASERFREAGRRALLVLNKVDAVKKGRLLKKAEEMWATGLVEEVYMTSARTGSGVERLREALGRRAEERGYKRDGDSGGVRESGDRAFAQELTRERLLEWLHDELPYVARVETEEWEEREDGSLWIRQRIVMGNARHVGMAVGRGGERLRALGTQARLEMERVFGRRVHVFLRVVVEGRRDGVD